MIRQVVLLVLIGLFFSACVQSLLFDCKRSPNYKYCPPAKR